MCTGRADEFRKEAVRIVLSTGLSGRQIADDPAVGFSILKKWVNVHRDTDVVPAEDRSMARENERRGARSAFSRSRGTFLRKPTSSSRA
jgi:transposase-like protein